MIRTLLLAGASAASLAMASPAFANEEASDELPVMTYGEWGFEPETLDPEVDPGDDFFAYANGKWVRENPQPAAYPRFGAFTALALETRDDVKSLVDELAASDNAAGSDQAKVGDAYMAYLDTDTIEAKGLVPTYPYLTEIYTAGSLEDLAKLWGTPGYPSLIGAGVTIDSKDPENYIPSVGFDGMGLPDRDYYLVDSERNQEIRRAYKEYLTFLLGKAGYADASGTADAVYSFEKKVAEIEWPRAAMRNRDITYNKLTGDELMAMAGDFPLAATLEAGGLAGQAAYLMPQIKPDAEEAGEAGVSEEVLATIGGGTPAMMELLSETPLPVLQAYMAAQFLSNNASVLPKEFDDASFAFFGKLLSGAQEQQPRWRRAIGAAEGQVGELLGKVYVERFFPPANKVAMDELVANLRVAMAESIASNDFMSEATRAEAKAKLDAFTPKIGYPENFETYEGLVIKADDAFGNRMRSAAWDEADGVSRLGKPVDKTEWFMLPQTVNAYYSSVGNEIVFPAAILQPPFFSLTADPAVNYGAIGGVIGHEIGHGFDDQGAKSDGTGTLRDWWTAEDKARFEELGNRLAAQYDSYCPYDDGQTCLNGRLTLGENIGDVGGLSLAYRAYKMSLNGEEAPVIDGLTGDQRFFLAWAQVWRSKQTEEVARQRLIVGPHSLEEYRVNGVVRNIDAWYDAFAVTEDDDLYLAPEERVKIW